MAQKEVRIFSAIQFAARAHAGQWRKGSTVPYIIHPLNVMKTLIEAGCEAHTVIAGILHDTVEDTHVTIEDIEKEFGNTIASIVEAVSYQDRKQLWEKRKEHVLYLIKNASQDIVLVELADKLDNIRSMREDHKRQGDDMWTKFKRGRDKQKWYYESLVLAFQERVGKGQASELFEQFRDLVRGVFSTAAQ